MDEEAGLCGGQSPAGAQQGLRDGFEGDAATWVEKIGGEGVGGGRGSRNCVQCGMQIDGHGCVNLDLPKRVKAALTDQVDTSGMKGRTSGCI